MVGGDPRGRGVVATANYVARRFGIHSAMSAAEALRRCPQAVFVRPRHSLYREHSRGVWETVRGVVPTIEQTGMEEGNLDLGEVAGDFLAARVVAEAVQTAVRAATSLTCSLGVAPCKVVAKVASDVASRAASSSCRRAAKPLSSRRSSCDGSPGVGPKAEERLQAGRRGDDRRPRGRQRRGATSPAPGRRRHDAPRPRAGHRPARARARQRDGSRSASRTRSSATSPTASASTTSCAAWPPRSPSALQRRGQVARTVTTKLRYADFSIRSRSTSLASGIDAAGDDRRPRLPPPRPRPARPAGRAAARRRRRLRPRRLPPARAGHCLASRPWREFPDRCTRRPCVSATSTGWCDVNNSLFP